MKSSAGSQSLMVKLAVCLLFVPFSFIRAQVLVCDGAKGPNLFTNYNNGTFGKGVPQNSGALGGATTYTYIPISCSTPSDGYYSVANSTDCSGTAGKVFGTWDVIGDHTGAADPIQGNPPPKPGTSAGYMMVVNASVGKDIAVADSIRGLCPNQVYEFQAWIRVLNPPGGFILPNLMFMINGTDAYATGDVKETTWKNVGFTFTVPANQKAIRVAIRNNAPGGMGNDWVLDDISVNTCNVKVKINADSVINVCEGATITLRDTITSVTGTSFPYYKWQKSKDNGNTWTDESPVLTETTDPKKYVATFPPFIATAGMNNYLFRLAVATDQDVLTKNDECDFAAIKITRLVVHPNPVIKATSDTICEGDTAILTVTGADLFKWSPAATLSSDTGKTVKATPKTNTTYTIIGKTLAGCPDTTTTTVIVRPLVADAGPDVHICPGDSIQLHASGGTTYSWSPPLGLSDTSIADPYAKPPATTTYTVTVSSGVCVDTDEVTVTLNPPILLSVDSLPPKCSGGSDGQATVIPVGGSGVFTYEWSPGGATTASMNGTPGTYTVIVTDQFGCKDTASTIIPNPAPIGGLTSFVTSNCNKPDGAASVDSIWGGTPGYTFSWNTSPVQTTQTAVNIVAGNYNVTITDANGCTAVLTAVVPNTPGISSSVAFSNVRCFGGNDGSAKVTGADGVAPYTYVWSNTQTTDTATNLAAGTYTVLVTDARGCPTTSTVTITQPAKINVETRDTSICPLGTAVLTAKGSGGTGTLNYTWNPGAATGNSIPVSPATTTTYSILATDANGCTGETMVTVTVHANPVITVAGDTICSGTSTQLVASGATKYSWTPSTGLNTTTENLVTASPATTITYTITGVDNNGCSSSTTVDLLVIPAPVITTTGGNACPGDTIHLTAAGALSYNWSPAGGLNTTTGNAVIAAVSTTTTYTVTGKGPNGCSSTATATATVNPVPEAAISASPNPASTFYPTIHFTDISGGDPVKWNWSFGDAKKSTSTKQHPSFTYPDSIEDYRVQLIVSNQFGCIDTTELIVGVKGEYSFYIANTFTPDGDGINDGFAPKGTGIDPDEYDFWIFDRWGNMIYHTTHWGDHWDGRAHGGENIAQIDTYVWKVRVRERDTHIRHDYIGHVNLVK